MGHILLLHHSEGERMRHVADWFGAGLASEQKVLYVDVAGWGPDVLYPELARHGLHVPGPLKQDHSSSSSSRTSSRWTRTGIFPR